jgi:hypothetical protein
LHAFAEWVGIAPAGARVFGVSRCARTSTLILTLEIPLEVLVGEKKSTTDEPIPNWLSGLGSETLEHLLAFRSWMEDSAGSFGDELQETIKRGWLPFIGGEHKEVH